MLAFFFRKGIECEMHAVLGIAKDHAKFSPVSTASYRLLPHINLLGPIPDEHIDHFVRCFSPGVMEVYVDENGKRAVRVKDARKDTVSREVLRHEKFEGLVELGRVRDHFICAFFLLLPSSSPPLLFFSFVGRSPPLCSGLGFGGVPSWRKDFHQL